MRGRRAVGAALLAALVGLSGVNASGRDPAPGSEVLVIAQGVSITAPRPLVPRAELPRGGTAILGHFRVVGYYGAAGTGALGVLGATSPDTAAAAITRRAAGFAGYGLPVQPTMELLATVAQRSPGPGGDYSKPVPAWRIRQYLAVAHAHRMLLVLDLQPGRASFLSQAQALRPFLLDPSVSLALDPEWKVGPTQVPGGGLIGSSSADGINDVSRWLGRLIAANHLPDKLLVVHQFTERMLPDRTRIVRPANVEVTFHADGFGTPTLKVRVYQRLAFPGRPYGAGFKLFLKQDSRLMTPREVMSLRPRPDVVTYQ